MSDIDRIIAALKNASSQKEIDRMSKIGIGHENAFGVSITNLREIAKPYRKNHKLALALWEMCYHETKILAVMIDDAQKVDLEQIFKWASQFYSWDICDLSC